MRVLLVIGLLVAVSSLAVGQPRPMDRRSGPDPTADRRAAIKQRIRVLRAATLTEELELDEKTLSRLLPTLARWDDVTEDLLKKRVDIQTRIEAANPAKDPKGVDRLIDEAVANQKSFWDLEAKRLSELRKILTPGQVARLLIVLPNFERRIQNQLRRAMANASRRGGGPRRGDPLDEDDEDIVDPRMQRRGR
jgi:hypothetical protein